MDIRSLLGEMVERGASDLYLTVDSPPDAAHRGCHGTVRQPKSLAADGGRGPGELADDASGSVPPSTRSWR